MKTSVIYCKDSNTKGIIDFYITSENESIYMFSQKYRRSTYDYYRNGVLLKDAFNYKKIHNDKAIMNVIKRFSPSISYIEKEYSVSIMNKTICAN